MVWRHTGQVALVCALLLGSVLPLLAVPPPANTTPAPATITTLPGDGLNLKVVDHINDHYVVVQVDPPVHNWFCGQFTNLPTDEQTVVGLSLEGMDTPGNTADVKKWVGLRPVMTYADPTKYETYEWFQKDEQGRWVSGDIFKQGDAKFAGTGKVPEQSAIPKEVAEQFLSEDGKYWQPWREIDHAEAVTGLNIFRMKQRFAYPTATVAMRVPYTYTLLQAYVSRLQESKLPGVSIDVIGKTSNGRMLQVIRLDDPECPPTPMVIEEALIYDDMPKETIYHIDDSPKQTIRPRVMLMTAREHATEHSSSWMLAGMLQFLLSSTDAAKQCRKGTTWLLVMIHDPDGSAASTFDGLTDHFMPHHTTLIDSTPAAVIAYGRYYRAFVNSGRPLECVTSVHSVECNENSNVSLPFAIRRELAFTKALTSFWFARLSNMKIRTDTSEPSQVGRIDNRLAGWANNSYHAIPLAFEMNDRYPAHRLQLAALQGIGESYPASLIDFLETPTGKERTTATRTFLEQRMQEMKKRWQTRSQSQYSPTIFELLALGY